MTFFDRTEQEIVANSLEQLTQNTNITQLTPGASARALLDIVSREQGIQHKIFDTNLMQAFIRFADNRFLEFFGDMMNLPIREARHAETDAYNFYFYVSSGVFGDINGGTDFVIPAGTIVSTVPFVGQVITPGIDSQEQINYVTTEDITCVSSESFVNATISASIEGSSSNVPRNVLNQHNFTSYSTSGQSLLKCTNRYSISNGEDRESPQSYKFRLANIFKAREMAGPMAIRLAALSVPGVSDIKEVMCEQGMGSYSIYVKSVNPTTSPKLLQEVSNICYQVSSYGLRPFILAPVPIGLEFICAVRWANRATVDDIARGYISMRDALEERLNTTDIGEIVVLADLVDVLLSSTRYAVAIGANSPNKFESVYVYKNDPSSDGTIRNITAGDKIVPLYNERIILETSGKYRGIQFLTGRQ
jgi:hypothetical protein